MAGILFFIGQSVSNDCFAADLPPLPATVPSSLEHMEPAISYAWSQQKPFAYRFKIELNVGDRTIELAGRNTLRATGARPEIEGSTGDLGNGSGSGFIVHPDGVIVTCAHVVKGAIHLTAKIGDQEVEATVIALDFEKDLALLKVDQRNLPFLKFGDSNKVRIAQEVRAIGFPLSDVLGESAKVTRGEVSGRGGPAEQDGLQIDATINPGNSGGPLVDNTGRVVGVTSSLLAGRGISEVGFAIPSQQVVTMAKESEVPIDVSEDATELAAPDLVSRVIPATVLLRVDRGPAGIGIDLPYELASQGYWSERESDSGFNISIPSLNHFDQKIVVDQLGQKIEMGKKGMLPYFLGHAAELGIETLPTSIPGKTTFSKPVYVTKQKHQQRTSGMSPFGRGFSMRSRLRAPWMLGHEREQPATKVLTGSETTTVSLTASKGSLVNMTKTYEMRINGESGSDEPYAIMKGKGNGKFDSANGRMQEFKYKATLAVTEKNVTVRIPISMNYELISDEEMAKERARIEQARKEQQKMKDERRAASEFGPSTSPEVTKTPDAPEPEYISIKDIPKSNRLDKFEIDK